MINECEFKLGCNGVYCKTIYKLLVTCIEIKAYLRNCTSYK